ncbi:hypothetical protein LJR231_002248 [Phyllobacterium sp. LjRoot231]|uniref:hypothetical protein n=1 Tax=Phyllobacterium sp. LjRoot231 TaxID=3342289 RepID=UPI003ECD349A
MIMAYLAIITGTVAVYFGLFWGGMALVDYRSALYRHAARSALYAALSLAFGLSAVTSSAVDALQRGMFQ